MTIIFSFDISGHNLEYLHHIYELCVEKTHERFVFLVQESFKDVRNLFKWENADNIEFEYIEPKVVEKAHRVGRIRRAYILSKLLQNSVRKYKADRVFSVSLMSLLPFIPFFISRKVILSGVIYKIYLYTWDSDSIKVKIGNIVKYLLLSYSKVIKDVFILNDGRSADELNEIYHVSKYKYLPDPFVPIPVADLMNIREQYGISLDKFVFSHFGAMREGKGTIEILRSLSLIPSYVKESSVFIFAGEICAEIRPFFYELLKKIPSDVRIIVEEKFCSYQYLASLCKASNALLIPYKDISQSSGVLGYSSQFGIPAIATNKGLLGQLVKEFELGLLIDNCDVSCLISAYSEVIAGKIKKPTNEYCNQNTVAKFQSIIRSNLPI